MRIDYAYTSLRVKLKVVFTMPKLVESTFTRFCQALLSLISYSTVYRFWPQNIIPKPAKYLSNVRQNWFVIA